MDSKKPTLKIEQEAKEFKKKKGPPPRPKPMTSRIYLAGQAMTALMILSNGLARTEDLKRESFSIADEFLKD